MRPNCELADKYLHLQDPSDTDMYNMFKERPGECTNLQGTSFAKSALMCLMLR